MLHKSVECCQNHYEQDDIDYEVCDEHILKTITDFASYGIAVLKVILNHVIECVRNWQQHN